MVIIIIIIVINGRLVAKVNLYQSITCSVDPRIAYNQLGFQCLTLRFYVHVSVCPRVEEGHGR